MCFVLALFVCYVNKRANIFRYILLSSVMRLWRGQMPAEEDVCRPLFSSLFLTVNISGWTVIRGAYICGRLPLSFQQRNLFRAGAMPALLAGGVPRAAGGNVS